MTDPSEPFTGDQPPSHEPIKPKRGAFPTPKPELEKAEPYDPDADEGDDLHGDESASADADPEKGG
jgi:hypothetical protein